MSNLIIFSEGNSQLIEDVAKKYTDLEVRTLNINELTNAEIYNPAVMILNISMEKLKDISMVTKFSVPVLAVVDEIPENITVRGEAFDYIVNPVNEYEFSVKIKNLIKIKELRDKISNISTTDELTGLHNRKFLIERLDSELSRAKRYNSPVSCILFDIDFFKVVNDMYGYEWGDVLLKKLSEMLQALARKEDVLTRYGDEEFILLLPDTEEANAYIFAERFRKDIEKMEFIPANEEEAHPVTISGGISAYPYLDNMEEDANSIIRYAEHALYSAKQKGKNQIVQFSRMNLDF